MVKPCTDTVCSLFCFVFFLLLHFSFGYLTISEAAVFHLRPEEHNYFHSNLWATLTKSFVLPSASPPAFFPVLFISVVSLPAYLKRVGKCCLVESVSGRYRTAYRRSTHRRLKFRARSFAVFRLDAAGTSFSHSLFCVSSPLSLFSFFFKSFTAKQDYGVPTPTDEPQPHGAYV